jgi:hypothetical protein
MQIVFRGSDTSEAHIIAGLLRANGIEAHVGGHHLQGGMGELAAIDFAHVHVSDEQAEQARMLIIQYDNAGKEATSDQKDKVNEVRPKWSLRLFVVSFSLILILIWVFAFAV